MLGDLNAREENEMIEGIVAQHGVPGRNESGERLLAQSAVGNSFFKEMYINTRW